MKNNQHGCEVEDEATGQILVCGGCAGHRAATATAPCGCDCRTVPPSGGHDFVDHDGCALVASSVATVCVRCEQWAGESDANCPGKPGPCLICQRIECEGGCM